MAKGDYKKLIVDSCEIPRLEEFLNGVKISDNMKIQLYKMTFEQLRLLERLVDIAFDAGLDTERAS